MSIFFDLFNPSNRHRTEELRRLENTREDESPGEPGRGPIDLNSGTVLIRVPTAEPAASDAESAAREGEDAADDDSADGESAGENREHEGEHEDAAASTEGDGGA